VRLWLLPLSSQSQQANTELLQSQRSSPWLLASRRYIENTLRAAHHTLHSDMSELHLFIFYVVTLKTGYVIISSTTIKLAFRARWSSQAAVFAIGFILRNKLLSRRVSLYALQFWNNPRKKNTLFFRHKSYNTLNYFVLFSC